MKRKHIITLALLLVLLIGGCGTYFLVVSKQPPPSQAKEQVASTIAKTATAHTFTNASNATIVPKKYTHIPIADINVLAEILAMNNDPNLKLISHFEAGSVTPGTLTDYLTKTAWGYIIKLKNSTPIASPSLVGDTMYVPGGFGSKSYYSFQLQSGKLIWASDLSDDGPSPAVFQDSTIIFNTESCTIFALNRFSGKMIWSHWIGDPLLSSPIVADNKVYTSYPSMGLHEGKKYKNIAPSHPFACFDLKTGNVLWQKWLDGDVLVTPIVDDKYIYLTTFPGTVYKVDKNNGNILASLALRATSPPTISNNKIFITRRSDDSSKIMESIAILDMSSLQLQKEFNKVQAPYLNYEIQRNTSFKDEATHWDAGNGFTGGAPSSSGWVQASKNIGQSNVSSLQLFQPSTVLPYKDNIACLMGNSIFYINPENNDVLWTYGLEGDTKKTGGSIATTPIICNNYLVTVTLKGRVIVLDINKGTVAYEMNLNKQVRTAPVAKNGYIIVPTTSGELNIINTGIKEIDGWNMFMKNPQHKI